MNPHRQHKHGRHCKSQIQREVSLQFWRDMNVSLIPRNAFWDPDPGIARHTIDL